MIQEIYSQKFSLTAKKIAQISKEIMIKIDAEQIKDIMNEFSSILHKLDYIQSIDTSQAKILDSPSEINNMHTFLQADIPNEPLKVTEVLQNAPHKNNQNYITVNDQNNETE